MSKIIFTEGIIKEYDMDREPGESETYYAISHIEEKEDLDGKNHEANNTNA